VGVDRGNETRRRRLGRCTRNGSNDLRLLTVTSYSSAALRPLLATSTAFTVKSWKLSSRGNRTLVLFGLLRNTSRKGRDVKSWLGCFAVLASGSCGTLSPKIQKSPRAKKIQRSRTTAVVVVVIKEAANRSIRERIVALDLRSSREAPSHVFEQAHEGRTLVSRIQAQECGARPRYVVEVFSSARDAFRVSSALLRGHFGCLLVVAAKR
jgi:hypothetical protein